MSNRFTEKAEKALNGAVKCAESFGHTYIGSEHILLSLSETTESVASVILAKHKASAEKIKKAIREYSGSGLKSTLSAKDMTPCSKKIVENSYRISVRYSASKIGTEHILLAVLDEKDAVCSKILSYIGVDISSLTDEVQTLLRCADKSAVKAKDTKEASSLRQHGKNLTDMARDGKIDPVIGREKETERLIRILCRKSKNNPCLIGEAGVGKTAIVEGLAQRIITNNVPSMLYGKEIISVDLTSMVSGTKYRGDFEERIKSMLNEAASNRSIILFIDEIHTIVGAGAAEGAIDAANILKPQLSRGELQIIGATTYAEYHKYIERDSALERRFQPIKIEEPSEEETKEIMYGLRERYESHHGVQITDEAIESCVRFSSRYIQDRFLPDKALDILDEACAKATATSNYIGKKEESEYKLRQIREEKSIAIQNGDFILAKNLHELEEDYMLPATDSDSSYKEITPQIKARDIKEIINEITGIPLGGIGNKINKAALLSSLSECVIGQERAIKTVVYAITRSEYGISDQGKPKGFYLFIGGSGVGKTELAKAIAKELYFDKNAFFKFDMSEFSESNSITKLIGSPPGYAGHEDGGALTERVRRHPYSILLFDEVEKAHPEVIDLFLQIADNGILTDSSGRSVNFRNCYIILTSNHGAGLFSDNSIGFIKYNAADVERKKINDELSKHFRIEFLNRIDEIILFEPINVEAMKKIATKKLAELKARLASMGFNLIYNPELAQFIAKEATDERFGVRNLLRYISTNIENPISDLLFSADESASETFKLDIVNGKITTKIIEDAPAYIK